MEEKKRPVGRPSELPESLEKAKEYLFGGFKVYGDVVPSVAGLACYIGKSREAMYEYGRQSEEFSDILEGILALQENTLINKGLSGCFNPTITKLMLTKHGYSDKQDLNGNLIIKNTVNADEMTDDQLAAIASGKPQ